MKCLGLFILLSVFQAHSAEPPSHLHSFLTQAHSHYQNHPTLPLFKNHYYSLHEQQKEAIVFLPGMGESSIKYYDLAESLPLTHSTYYSWDHLGQGFSTHLLPDSIDKIHIERFEDHLAPLVTFLTNLRKQHQKITLIAHSMGAHLALRLAYEHPELVDQLILSAPLVDIRPPPIPIEILEWITSPLPGSYYPPFYFLFKKKLASESLLTHSVERQLTFQKTVDVFPTIKRQGATLGWIRAARVSIDIMSHYQFSNIKIPIYILQAEDDYLVDNQKQNTMCAQIPNCHLEVVKGSKHEILFEIDSVRDIAINKIKEILQSSKTNGNSSLNKSVF